MTSVYDTGISLLYLKQPVATHNISVMHYNRDYNVL